MSENALNEGEQVQVVVDGPVEVFDVVAENYVQLTLFQYRLLVFGLPLLLVAGLAGSLYYAKSYLQAELVSRPPIAVMPVRDSVLRLAKDSKNPMTLDDAINKVSASAKLLKDNGYLVIDADYVYAYPGDVEANP